ncbi:MAG: hypothetical protein ACKVN9_08670 [Methylophilaceae bacterium]
MKTMKTAGTSIEVFLSQHCDALDIVTPINPPVAPHFPRNYGNFYNHIPAHEIRAQMGSQIWDSYFKFCVERNPWDKVISDFHFWKNWKHHDLTFEQYLSNKIFPINFPLYAEPSDAQRIIVDEVLSYERLDDELNRVFTSLGIPFQGALGVYAKSEFRIDKLHYSEVFTADQAAVINNAFSQEIALHGYQFDS